MYTPVGFFAPQGGGIITDGLVLYYDANNTSCYPGSGTDVFDLSTAGNDGSMVSSLPVNTAGGVYYWDWDDSQNTRRIEVPHSNDFNMNTAISMEVWFWIPDFNAAKNGEQHYFAKQYDASSHSAAGYQFVMRTRPDGPDGLNTWVNTEGSSNNFYYQYSAWDTAQVWQQFVATWNTTDYYWRYYWNGQPIATSTAKTEPFTTATSGILYLGAHIPGVNGQPKGRASIFRLYKDKLLSDAEVLQNFDADKSIFGL